MPGCKGCLERIGKDACPDFTATAKALAVLENITETLEHAIAEEASELVAKINRQTLLHTDIETAVSMALGLNYFSGKNGCRTCKNIGFSSAALKRELARHRIKRSSPDAVTKLNGILTDIMADIINRSCKVARDNKHLRIKTRDIAEAIAAEKNEKFRGFLQQGSVRGAGLLANPEKQPGAYTGV